MSDTQRPKTAGDKMSADEVNKDLPILLNAGETINGATLPVAVYVHTDGELYACDGNDTAKLNFIGFAVSNSTDGNPIQLQKDGLVSGFSGLTIGSKYYVQDDKTIGTTLSTTMRILVGRAISETELFIEKAELYTSFLATRAMNVASGSVNYAHGLGVIPKRVKITAMGGAEYHEMAHSIGIYNGNSINTLYNTDAIPGVVGTDTTNLVHIDLSSNKTQNAIPTWDVTNIILAWTKGAGTSTKNTQMLIEVWA